MCRKPKLFQIFSITIVRRCLGPLIILCLLFACNLSNNSLNQTKKDLEKTSDKSSVKVALLLPLESNSEKTNILAQQLANAAHLAVKDLKTVNIKLSIFPTAGIDAKAVNAAKTALELGNEIIVGPLFSEETLAIKNNLKNKNVKIISLSNNPALAGNNVFVFGDTFDSISNHLVKFSIENGLKRIAIIAPSGAKGSAGIYSVEQAIKRSDAIVTMVSRYQLDLKNINRVAPSIFENLIETSTEVVIFTDTPTRGLGFIAEQLSRLFEENRKKAPKFMGLTRWDLAQQMLFEESLRGGWFVIPSHNLNNTFSNRYAKAFGVNSVSLSIMSYDAIKLIHHLIETSRHKEIVNAFHKKRLTDPKGFLGINGGFRFNDKGIVQRPLTVAEVASGRFKIIDRDSSSLIQKSRDK